MLTNIHLVISVTCTVFPQCCSCHFTMLCITPEPKCTYPCIPPFCSKVTLAGRCFLLAYISSSSSIHCFPGSNNYNILQIECDVYFIQIRIWMLSLWADVRLLALPSFSQLPLLALNHGSLTFFFFFFFMCSKRSLAENSIIAMKI